MSLRNKAIKGGIATVSGQVLKFALRVAYIAILARYLSPSDYGVVAMATSIAVILEIFREAGLSTATLQRPQISQIELSSMFWLNVGLGLIVALGTAALGPLAAWFYDQPALKTVLPAMGAIGFVSSFSVQKAALLQRDMAFGKLALADVGSQALALAAGVYAAMNELGFWSLIIAQAVGAMANNTAIAFSSPWRPNFAYSHAAAKPLLGFGSSIMASNFLNQVSRGIDALIIGYAFGTHAVGLYNRAQNILKTPLRQFIGPVINVSRAAIFRTVEQPARFSRSVAAALGLISFASALTVLAALSMASPAVLLLLGREWTACIPIFMALTPFAFMEPSASFLSAVMVAKGNSRPLLKWRIVSIAIIAAGLALGIQWGVLGMALTYALSGLFIRMPLFMLYTCRVSGISFRSSAAYLVPVFLAGALGSAVPVWRFLSAGEASIGQSCIDLCLSLVLFLASLALSPNGRKVYGIILWLGRRKGGSLESTLGS